MEEKITFPNDFIWGTATSAYQIEGGWQAEGKGESIWDRFSHTQGKILNGDTGDLACDHYHRWKEDLELLTFLGVDAYRFSVSWPRILPEGIGEVNPAGLDFYSRMVDHLLAAGITPFLTLNHWDLPQALEERGGWPSRISTAAFREYADVVSRHLGDRVKNWITHNEPWVIAFLGYQSGVFAPGKQSWEDALRAAHHLLVSHGEAVPVIRENSRGCEVGITLNLTDVQPASSREQDQQAAGRLDGHVNRWFLDPLFRKRYPEDMLACYRKLGYLPADFGDLVQEGDLEAAAEKTDFLGVNYYTRAVVSETDPPGRIPSIDSFPEGTPRTDTGWEIYPEGLVNVLCRLHEEYKIPKIYITENGASFDDSPDQEGRIRDARRIAYLHSHFCSAGKSIQQGVPLAGYFVWSLLDNFEWASGYSQRFGLVWVDFTTLERTPKDSAVWIKNITAKNSLVCPPEPLEFGSER